MSFCQSGMNKNIVNYKRAIDSTDGLFNKFLYNFTWSFDLTSNNIVFRILSISIYIYLIYFKIIYICYIFFIQLIIIIILNLKKWIFYSSKNVSWHIMKMSISTHPTFQNRPKGRNNRLYITVNCCNIFAVKLLISLETSIK